jgi:hypothetical protein
MGRPPLHAQSMRAHNVRLDPETVETLREYGDGNLSLGIRRAAKLVE